MRVFRTFVALCAGALVVAIPAGASAKPIVHDHYSDTDTDTFTDTECGAPITIDYSAEFSGVFKLQVKKATAPIPYLSDNYSGCRAIHERRQRQDGHAPASRPVQGRPRRTGRGNHLPVHGDRDRSSGRRDRSRRQEVDLRPGPDPLHGPHRDLRRQRHRQRHLPRRGSSSHPSPVRIPSSTASSTSATPST